MSRRGVLLFAAAGMLASMVVGCGGSSSSIASDAFGGDAPKADARPDGRPDASADAKADGRDGAADLGGSGGASGDAPFMPDAYTDAADALVDVRDVGPPPCYLNIVPLSEPQFDDFERSLTPFRVRGTATTNQDADIWAWTIDNPDGSKLTTPTKVEGDQKTVEFPIQQTGLFHVTVAISNRRECLPVTYPLQIIEPLPASFVFRVFPPTSLAVPVQEFSRTREQLAAPLGLDSQIRQISLFTYDNVGRVLPTYVQITSPATALVIQGNTASGQFRVPLLQDRAYDRLLIPDSNAPFAPTQTSGLPKDLDAPILRFDPGIPVTGQTLRWDDSPVVDARLVLRQGIRPSTIGISVSDGSFSLFTREGTMSVDIDAPPGSGLPDGHINASDGITLGQNASELTMTMHWAELQAGPLTLTVHGKDGSAVAGAGVHLELTDPPDPAGQLTVHFPDAPDGTADVALPVTGSLRADASTDSQGVVTFPALTVGHYRVTVRPTSPADPQAAVTAAAVEVTAAGATADVRIAQKIRLSGTVRGAAGSSKGVRITAIDTGTDVVSTTASATVDDGGAFTLLVDPGRTYKLWATPAANQPFARTFISQQLVPSANLTLAPFVLPAGVQVTGSVSTTASVAGALVQVYCPPLSTSCPDASLPLAEAVTDGKGSFTVVLPDVGAAGFPQK